MRLAAAFALLVIAPLPLTVAVAGGAVAETGVSATAPPLQARTEERPGFTRVVLPAAPHGRYWVRRAGSTLTVIRPPGRTLADPALPRNVIGWSSGPESTVIVFAPGSVVRVSQPGRGLMIEVRDPAHPVMPTVATAGPAMPAASGAPIATTAPTLPVQAVTLPQGAATAQAPAPAPATALTTVPATAPATAPATLPTAPTAPAAALSQAVKILRLTAPGDPSILLPAAEEVGVAAFRSGGELVVVLDAPITYEPPGPGPIFDGISSRRMQDATVVRIPLADSTDVQVTRSQRGWRVVAGTPADTFAGIAPRLVEDRPGVATLRFPITQPSRVVSVTDPSTGALLLVGTQRVAGEAVRMPLEYIQFSLYPTVQGVVVAALSDDIRLKRDASGFILSAGPLGGGTILSGRSPGAPTAARAPTLSRLFSFHNDPLATQIATLNRAVKQAQDAPALARALPRLNVAEAMLALGMDVEAQTVLAVAYADDPSLQDMPSAIALRAVAAIVAGRLDDVAGIYDPRLGRTAEGEFWRAMVKVARDEVTPADAKILADTLPLMMNYPASLRDRVLPRALQAMAMNGQAEKAQATLNTLPERRELDLARAMAFEATGQAASALQAYDQVKDRSDRLARHGAIVRSTELRLKEGGLDAKQAADVLDRALFGWREPRDERAMRLRVAALRRQSGQWREALAVLKEGRVALPEDRALFDAELAKTFTELFAGGAAETMPPADLVALYDKNLDIVQSITWPEPVGLRLVDRLSALSLQGRAEPIMTGLLERAGPDRKPDLGARLATLRLDTGAPTAAIAALAASVPPAATPISEATMVNRQLLYAQAESNRGNTDVALSMFKEIGTPVADEARADIYTGRKDWGMAVSALTDLERKTIPAPGALSAEQQALVMRLAVAATLGGDTATLSRVTGSYGAAMASGSSANLFRLVTSTPVQDTADLPRAFDEIQLARTLPPPPGQPVAR